MGRRRTHNYHLPPRVYQNRGWLFYVAQDGSWHKLGREWDRAAKDRWVELTTGYAPEGTVSELLDSFIKHTETMVRQGKRSSRTLEGNLVEVDMLKLVFGRSLYSSITSKHVATYLRQRADKESNPAPIRANREIALLSSAYSWAMGEDRYNITTNPCYGVRRNTEKPRTRYVETEELRQFVKKYAPRWLRCYVLLKRMTAMRQGDMLKITDASLTERGIAFTTGKTGRKVIVRWSWGLRSVVRAAQALRPALPENVETMLPRSLFLSRFGTAMTSRGFKTAWQRAMQAYAQDGNARFWEHDIRAKTASDMEDIASAQTLLGHESTTTTKRHYRRAPVKVRPLR